MTKPLKLTEIADRMRFSTCLRCDGEIAVRVWREVEPGILEGACDLCGKLHRAFLYEHGKPMFDRPTTGEPPGDAEPEPPPPDEEPDPRQTERAERARANLRLLDDEPKPNSPEDIGGSRSGWRNVPAPPDPTDLLAELKTAVREAPTARERMAAERKLRKMRKEAAAGRQADMFGGKGTKKR